MRSLIKISCIFYIVLFTNLYAIELNNTFTKIPITHKSFLTYIDKDNLKSTNYVIENQDKLFRHIEKSFFPYSYSSIWTKLSIKNISDKTIGFYLVNDFPALDEIDIFLIKNKKIYKTIYLGDMRKVPSHEIFKRFANLSINLEKEEKIDVLIRYSSSTPINTKLKIFSDDFYSTFVLQDFTILGFFLGITLALVIYNLMIYFSLKQKAFLFYVLHVLVNLYNALSSSGHVFIFLNSIFSNVVLDISYKIATSLGVVFLSFFIIYLFELKKNIFWLYKIHKIIIYTMYVFIGSIIFFYLSDNVVFYNKISAVLIQTSLFITIVSIIVIAYKKLLGSLYFVFGMGTYCVSILLYVLYFLGKVNFDLWIVYAFAFGITIDAIFSSMALGKRIKQIEAQRLENAILVEESNKFNSTSYLLAGILHQFKQPIIHLGAEILNLRVENFKKNQNNIKENNILKNMENQIGDMNSLVENFYSFYSKKSDYCSFNLKDAVDKTISILNSSLQAYNIEIAKEYKTTSITSDEKSLNQVLMIILENAISILVERKIDKPKISILVNKKNKFTNIIIEDNAGGINKNDIDKIFTVHYSKRDDKGLGIGLALAKNLIEKKLNGEIEVENTNVGASFKIII